MNLEIKGIHYELSEKTIQQIEKKVKTGEFADDFIVDLLFRVEKEKDLYIISVNINFKHGLSHHIQVEDHHLYDGIDKIIDKIKNKVTKEKERIQERN
jgi:putative sigma-54 modulation protein